MLDNTVMIQANLATKVSVDPIETMVEIRKLWQKSIGIPRDSYIDGIDRWWDPNAGSGYGGHTGTAVRTATKDEIKIYRSYVIIIEDALNA